VKWKEGIAPLPTMLTLGNLAFGFASIALATVADPSRQILHIKYAPFVFASYALLLSMVCDALDGFVARHTGGTSVFGEQLDSLADMVSFGVAPAVLAREVVSEFAGGWFRPWTLLLVAGWYIACTALRLARFNIETETSKESHLQFKGLPSPAAGATISAFVILHLYFGYPPDWLRFDIVTRFYNNVHESAIIALLLPAALFATGLLMVSTFKYFHVVGKVLARKKDPSMLPLSMILLPLGILFFQVAFPVAMLIYIASGPIGIGLDRYLDWLDRIHGENGDTDDF